MASIKVTTILNITHLDFILSELKRFNFSEAKWEEFGLNCGLYKGRLETLEADYPKNASKCFRECIGHWLKREDGVDEKGKPTLERLADIVEETGDKATAEKIRIRDGIVTPAKDLEFHQVTQSTGMPTALAQSSTSLWWIMLPVSILVVLIIVAMYMPYMYSVLCSVFDPTVTKPIDEYASKLREKYNKTLTRYKDPDINKYPAAGPTSSAVPFIPLELIRLKSHQKKADAEVLHSVSADKDIQEHDNIEKIEIDDIFKPLTDKQLRFVLITGEPGIGKSTLAKELTLRWVRQTDAVLIDYKIVILIPLRLETYQKAKTIEDLLIDVDDINEAKVIPSIYGTKGAGVLWILDGFDELPHHLRNSSNSIFIKLIKGDIFPESAVIITSRHAATDPLLTFLEDDSKHIALRGFGSNEILEYASKYLKNDTIVSEFKSFYSGNTVIENMLYNPMNCFIMCKIFTDFTHTKNNNNKHPITMTEIYSYYVRALLKRHLIDAKVIDINYEMPLHLIQEVDFRNSKLNNIWKHFDYLSKLAYEGVMKQEYIFGKELHDIPKLSMMDTISSYTGFDKDESSSFIHTTLQNYFAAIYFINNPHLMFTETDIKQNSNLENVFIFYVGLSKDVDRKIGTLDMLRTDVFRSYNIIHIQISSLMLRCLYENSLILHNKDYNLVSGHTWSVANVPMNNFDYFIAGYIVAAHNITLRINVSHFTELEAFKKGLQFQQASVNGKINIRLPYRLIFSKDPVAEVDLPSNAVIGLNLMVELNINAICQLISKFPLLEELFIVIYRNFYCYLTVSEHPLMKLSKLERLSIVIMSFSYDSNLELLKQLVVPGRPLKQLTVLVPMKTIDTYMYTEIMNSAIQSSLDELRIHVLIDVVVPFKFIFLWYKPYVYYEEALDIILNKEKNSLTVNYYQLFVHHLGATQEIQLRSFTSFVYYKVKDEMVHRLDITIYSESVTSSLNDFISAFMNCTSTLKLTRNLNTADYVNHKIKLSRSMYAIVSPANPVPYDAGKTATKYGLYMRLGGFFKLVIDILPFYLFTPITIELEETPSSSRAILFGYLTFIGDFDIGVVNIVLACVLFLILRVSCVNRR